MISNNLILQVDPEGFKYFLNHPLISIGAIVLAFGFLKIGGNVIKWIERTIKDDFISKTLIILAIIGLAFLYLVILYQFKEQ